MSLSHHKDWKDGEYLEEIIIWTINPMMELLEIYDEYTEEDNDKRLTFFYYALREKLEELEEVINGWVKQRRKEEKEQKVVNL